MIKSLTLYLVNVKIIVHSKIFTFLFFWILNAPSKIFPCLSHFPEKSITNLLAAWGYAAK